jgi:DNA helicase-2/ATP-dependent DNA helicase PcrA
MRDGAEAAAAALDERQLEAVRAGPGPLLVLAGAGSGKTRVLTRRTAELVSAGGVPAEALLVITFTNRAADELRQRLRALVGERPALRMTIGTFHAVCHRLVRRHARRAGRTPVFSVYDQAASRRLVRRTPG